MISFFFKCTTHQTQIIYGCKLTYIIRRSTSDSESLVSTIVFVISNHLINIFPLAKMGFHYRERAVKATVNHKFLCPLVRFYHLLKNINIEGDNFEKRITHQTQLIYGHRTADIVRKPTSDGELYISIITLVSSNDLINFFYILTWNFAIVKK